jgi:hypothetical protein
MSDSTQSRTIDKLRSANDLIRAQRVSSLQVKTIVEKFRDENPGYSLQSRRIRV